MNSRFRESSDRYDDPLEDIHDRLDREREYDDHRMDLDKSDFPRRKGCHDRMCGADDCPVCRPGNFRGGVYIRDLEGI